MNVLKKGRAFCSWLEALRVRVLRIVFLVVPRLAMLVKRLFCFLDEVISIELMFVILVHCDPPRRMRRLEAGAHSKNVSVLELYRINAIL